MPKFQTKPIIVEAWQYNGPNQDLPPCLNDDNHYFSYKDTDLLYIKTKTLGVDVFARPGDWIIQGIENELYPCKPDIFDKTYEPVKE